MVISQDKEDKLQKLMYILNQIADKYGFQISSDKTKTMVFRGKQPVSNKIVIDEKIMRKSSISITRHATLHVWQKLI